MKKTKNIKRTKGHKNKFIKALTKFFINKYILLILILSLMITAVALVLIVNKIIPYGIGFELLTNFSITLITLHSIMLFILLLWVIKNKKIFKKKKKDKWAIALLITILIFNLLMLGANSYSLYIFSGMVDHVPTTSIDVVEILPNVVYFSIGASLAFALTSLIILIYLIIKSKVKS